MILIDPPPWLFGYNSRPEDYRAWIAELESRTEDDPEIAEAIADAQKGLASALARAAAQAAQG